MNFSVISSQFWSLLLQGTALGFIYVLISLGYTMVYGVLRLINFANSEVVMVGTFATVIAQVTILNNPADSDPLSGFNLVTTLLFSALFFGSCLRHFRNTCRNCGLSTITSSRN